MVEADCAIAADDPLDGYAEVDIGAVDHSDRESPLAITLAIGMSRGERMDWIVQKSVELGVAAIQPLITQRTEVRLKGERSAKRLAHWRQIAIAACEQSGRNRVPEIPSLPVSSARWQPPRPLKMLSSAPAFSRSTRSRWWLGPVSRAIRMPSAST